MFANLYGVGFLFLIILAFGLNNMLPFPAWYGCSITLLLESVDFTGRIKCPVGGLIETATCGVARGNGLFLSLFSRFSPAARRAFLAGARNVRGGCQQRC